MKFALNGVTIQPAPLLEKIRVAGEAGYDGIELHVHELLDWLVDGGRLEDVNEALEREGLVVPCMLGFRNWGDLQGQDYRIHLFEARRRMRLCGRVGCPRLVCSTPMYQADWSGLHERFRDLLEMGMEEGVQPVFEFIGHYASVRTFHDALTVLERTGRADAAMCLDAFHFWNGGSAWKDLTQANVSRVAHVHLDDATREKAAGEQEDQDRVMVGDGQIDLRRFVDLLCEGGYGGWYSLELFDRRLWKASPEEVAETGLKRMKALFPTAGEA